MALSARCALHLQTAATSKHNSCLHHFDTGLGGGGAGCLLGMAGLCSLSNLDELPPELPAPTTAVAINCSMCLGMRILTVEDCF